MHRPEKLISVVIVNYKVAPSLRQALQSVREGELYDRTEVIVVDNASNDLSKETITAEFPEAKWVQLKQNIGFGKACNIGARMAKGEYLLILNPDTIIGRNTLSSALDFMESHPEVGLLGPKLLNPDGTLQQGGRRGFPTPAAAFYRFIGLSRIFPKSKRFGHYNLSYLEPDLSCQVDSISGCFMFIKGELFRNIGGFDERFFMYGEDLDLCWRVREKGFKVWYHPEIRVIHLKGKSSAKRLFKSRIAFYEAMILFSKKYQHLQGTFFPSWLMYAGVMALAAINLGTNLVRSFTASIIDLTIINFALWACLTLRFLNQTTSPYDLPGVMTMGSVHALLSAAFLSMFAYNGVYSRKKYSAVNVLLSGFLASIMFMTFVYFIKSIAFSRIAFAGATLIIVALLIGWREIVPKILHQFLRIVYARDKVVIIGSGTVPMMVIQNIEKHKTASIVGILWTGDQECPGQFEGYPVLGKLEDVAEVIQRIKIDSILIATAVPWYSYIIEALAKIKAKNLSIRWVPRELFNKRAEELPAAIPLHDFNV